ncbi:unnamed protein product [Rotaria magnacalcarata]|uniref:Phosphatidic acid phosphatase type 2/haloperoxidase domain-containing protein n=5 Tax=Rotaria magnacalcarata TaxID=392030 RepID=A0A816PG11_9BILA|nr:unnamed protein product [Rotaria magnacalcarata]CAF1608941.1 unnamed protein product [Rotaria magnacalcarata]CAF2047598.1 unnamed protein product [Rotaria magnacalcarata]CAF2196296.1 unnamed protein product [Rotaria magnacalcarata]CAF3802765.1 unnamed protein product [Rotaria magnacalcarata]
MWNSLRSYATWLHEPEHVAGFQHYFGVLPKSNRIETLNANNLNKNNNNNNIINDDDYDYKRIPDEKRNFDSNVLDECIEERKHSANQTQNQNKEKNSLELDYKITSWFWYYFFQFGAALGNEIFYILFFPTWIWNVDGAVARKISILWAFFMYIGQATKDILAIPRPSSPPVLKLEKRYVEEYGFPSTHAMFAAGIPLSLVLLSLQRYDFNMWIGLAAAAIVCVWVCLSRIYLGMHTFLDIIAGTIYALILIFIMFPYVDSIDNFQLTHSFAPILNFSIGILLIKCYPSLKLWSTARSDTTVILGSAFGLCSATTAMHQIGLLEKPLTPPLYSIIAPNLGLCIVRTILGMIFIYATRQIVKTVVLRVTCSIYGLDWKNPESKRLAKVEMPYYYLTYFAIGFNISFTCPLFFRAIGINRDYSYTEL